MSIFPFDKVRPEQGKLIEDINLAIKNGRSIIAHAPTGLGKTAAALSPAIEFAIEKGLTVFFLTSRNTQHTLVMETLKEIYKKKKIVAVDFVGKKGMCPPLKDYEEKMINFFEFCRNRRENGTCLEYKRTIKKSDYTSRADEFVDELVKYGPLNVEEVVDSCKNRFCAYELSMRLAQKARVIVADYYHLFSPYIRKIFLSKIKKDLQKSIVIVDEAHNLPSRIRNLLTTKISTLSLNKLAENLTGELKSKISEISNRLHSAGERLTDTKEVISNKEDFIELVETATEDKYSSFVKELEELRKDSEDLDEEEDITKLIYFLKSWLGDDNGFVRILRSDKTKTGTPFISLEYNCLHPGTLSGDLFNMVHSSILMSGTLVPPEMYREILGLKRDTILRVYSNPFPKKNRLVLISKDLTTKYESRTDEMFKKIAAACAQVINNVNGNSAVFFSSYSILRKTMLYLNNISSKELFIEHRGLNKEDRWNLLTKFKKNLINGGGALIGVQGANFSEGIDLPGDLLKAVVIVGLPFAPPDLRQKSVINYYENNFGKGWDYGYIFPAMNRALQAAGRCIRSETDKGVIVFLDKRFAWNKYINIIPPDWNPEVTNEFANKISNFFVDA